METKYAYIILVEKSLGKRPLETVGNKRMTSIWILGK
jgi:hypothetical protein